MMGQTATLFFGAIFGLALAAPPGPMNAIIAQESVIRGWWAGVTAGVGAMAADLCFFLLALGGVATILGSNPRLRAAMMGAGGLLMVYFAYGAIQDARDGVDWDESTSGRGFWKALGLGLTNPYQIAFWITVGVGLLSPGTVDVLAAVPAVGEAMAGVLMVRSGSPALIVGLFGGITVWITAFPAALVVAGRRIEAFVPAVAYGSAGVLFAFGAWFLVEGAGGLA